MPLEYEVRAEILRPGVAVAATNDAEVYFDSSPKGLPRLMNPAELLLSAFAACVLKNVERYGHILSFRWAKAAIEVRGVRQDAPPRMVSVTYVLHLWTDEPPPRVDLLHRNLRKFGTIFNTVAAACEVEGRIEAHPPSAS